VDRRIASVASKQAGVYDLHLDTTPDAERAARRMRDLERLGLVSPAGANRWKVPPDLLEQLERQHRGAPDRYRLRMHKHPLSLQAQVRYPGPVWLDRVETAALAPYGLGAEVGRAIERRRDALRHIGMAPDDPNRFEKLRELERRSVGKDLAASSGQSFVPSAPDGFRGRLQAHATPAGAAYSVVSDGSRFVVVKTTRSLRDLQGKQVVFGRDAKGRLVVRSATDRNLE
jgi:hypothetical protein